MMVLNIRRQELNGRLLSSDEAELLASRLPMSSDRLVGLMRRYPLIGMTFTVPPDEDLSGLGAELRWLAPADMIGESFDFYPGISALRLGYLAIGSCLRGSGDPYFVKVAVDDPPFVRIPHDYLLADLSLVEARVEIVRSTLSDFFRVARFG